MQLLEKFLYEELKIRETSSFMKLFEEYQTLLLDWNKKINLVSRKTDSIENHILNSIFFLKKYSFEEENKLIDIGTGGGFPGIPLKILFPALNITFLDSVAKKTMVVKEISEKLELKADILTGRSEEISQKPNFKGKYEVVISKAVSTLDNLYKWANAFLSPQGKMLCIKGGDMTGEIDDLKKQFPKANTEVIEYSFPDEYNIEDKKLVIINKQCL
jgi:16S rRNA (guanine527-N7)-methyltransferase